MSKTTPTIVIVGAGAMGILSGYHLALGGAAITYLVRPSRIAELQSTLKLYSYDDAATHEYAGYSLVSDPADITKLEPDFVLVTVDGASLTSDEGMTTLRAIGAAIRELDTTLIIGSVGIGLREKAIAASGLADERVINGGLTLLAHQTKGVNLPIHAPTDPRELQASDFAFRHLNDTGFRLENRNASAASWFADIFDKSGIGKCAVISSEEFGTQSRGIIPIFITCQILGWPNAGELYADPLWSITVDAVRAVQGLAAHGDAGKASAAELTSERLVGIWNHLTVASLPLDWMGFNAFHHGQKVNSSDILLLRSCADSGDAEKRDMSSVRQIIAAWEARRDIPRRVSRSG